MVQTKEEIGMYWIPSLNQELPNYLNFSLRQALFSSFCRWRLSDSGSPPWSELSRVQLFVNPGTVAHQAPLFMEFSRQEYGSELPFHFLGALPSPGIKPGSPALQADSLPAELLGMGGRYTREGLHVYLWLIYGEVSQTTTKVYKAIILQSKNKLIK